MRSTYLSRYLDVLGPDRKTFLEAALSATFAPATVLGDGKWRKASVCMGWPLLEEAKLALADALDVRIDDVIDLQLTVSRDGDYFLPHHDNNYPETAERRITFVYYLGQRETFIDGALNFPELGVKVEPIDDSLIFFSAGELHEIEKVDTYPLGNLPGSGRYTLNGWLR